MLERVGRWLVVVAVAGCTGTRNSGPAIDAVEPASGRNTEMTPIEIRGTDFDPLVSNLDNGGTKLATVTVTIGSVELADAEWRNDQLVVGTVPQGFDVGRYDVTRLRMRRQSGRSEHVAVI
jgi:hypothetical protein